MNEDAQIHCYTEGQLGFCQLNRPKQLNALTIEMNQQMRQALLAWREDPVIKAVVITSSSGRAFCAGGDIKLAYQLGQQAPEKALAFFEEEYAINLLIATYPKPIIAYCQGITMGGGCGIGFHASHAIAGDRIKLAMPETKIGLFPDIGASYVLPRIQHHMGDYLGLTGEIIGQQDVLYTGLMRYAMHDQNWQDFLEKLKQLAWGDDAYVDVDQALIEYQLEASGKSELAQIEPWVQRLFSAESLSELLNHSVAAQSPEEQTWQDKIMATLKQRSPQSLVMTWQAFKLGQTMTLEQVLQQDLKLVALCLASEEFYMGVKACLIDRCEPRWLQQDISAYTPDMIAQWFANDKEIR
jgi:enoyl-CoA hydratase/carnithine racemase